MNRLLATLAALAILAALGVALVLQWAGADAQREGPLENDLRITVQPGRSLRAVLGELADAGAIRNPRLFELYLRCCSERHSGAPSIKAGDYLIAAQADALSILDQLVDGRVVLEQLTIVEGWSFAQMRAALAAHPRIGQSLRGIGDADLMKRLGRAGEHPEGRFFPDTYRFAAGTPDLQILQLAHARMTRELQAAWEQRVPQLPLRSADEALTLASIVEKETGLPSERPRIAGVFVNRLRLGMRLQSDPTVIYGLGARYDGDIRSRDLVADTPYNTYARAGLPPTPIALPGLDALRATTRPEPTDALYFVATGLGDGSHQFSATLEQHNAAVRRFLARERGAAQPPPAPRNGNATGGSAR